MWSRCFMFLFKSSLMRTFSFLGGVILIWFAKYFIFFSPSLFLSNFYFPSLFAKKNEFSPNLFWSHFKFCFIKRKINRYSLCKSLGFFNLLFHLFFSSNVRTINGVFPLLLINRIHFHFHHLFISTTNAFCELFLEKYI